MDSKTPGLSTQDRLIRNNRNGRNDDGASIASFKEYPSSKPFINSDYNPPSNKQTSAVPESNRDAVISALKNLQDKIRRLELQRTSAESNLRALASETTQYKDMLQKSYQTEGARQSLVNKQTQVLESQLTSAETRCHLLEKQLDYMRRMVHDAEQGRHEEVKKASQAAREKQQAADQRSHKETISQLERDRLKLAATENIAQKKIKDLEEQLLRERLQRRCLEEHTAVLSADDAIGRSPPAKTKKLVKKKKRKEKTSKQSTRHPRTVSEPGRHFRINLAEIPFVAGQSTTPSHSVGANVQKVIALMKTHNLALCNGGLPTPSPSTSRSSTPDSDTDLTELLLQLQDEFGEMSFEHEELMRQLNDTDNESLRQELERELDSLVSRMEAKSQQISRVRKHQVMVDVKPRKKKTLRPRSAMARLPSQRSGEVKVTTTVRTSGHGSGKVKVMSSPSAGNSLCVLKDMKKLQTTLRREDMHWGK